MENKKTISPKNTYSKAEKLKSRKAIDGLFKGGKSFFIHPYKVFYQMTDGGWQMADGGLKVENAANADVTLKQNRELMPADNQPSAIRHASSIIQVGFAVSTKNFKHAVDRNRIKRLGREAYRLNKHLLVSHLANQQLQLQVFFVFTNKSLPTFVNVQSAMQACLRKLIKITKKDEGLLQG